MNAKNSTNAANSDFWFNFNDGLSIGQTGTEGGEIIRDEEHIRGARITLEEDCLVPFAITCAVYGWFFHTRFFETEDEADEQFDAMKRELAKILEIIPAEDEATDEEMAEVTFAIEDFVEQYP